MARSAQDKAQPAGEICRKKLCCPNDTIPVRTMITAYAQNAGRFGWYRLPSCSGDRRRGAPRRSSDHVTSASFTIVRTSERTNESRPAGAHALKTMP